MGNILLFSLIVGLAMALLLVPMTIMKKQHKKEGYPSFPALFGATLIITSLVVFVFYYLTNLDQNFTSMWILLIIASGFGAALSTGKERLVKSLLFLATLCVGAYFMTAFVFNADKKFESAKMEVKTEIQAFDEKETPASVPPQFARNKMKKAFGQVPNTSYYELGNLQIQKVDGEYVYIAPVEFSGFFKWLKGDETPGYFKLSATDSNANPKFIKEEMVYTPSAFFNKKIERHIRLNYPKEIFNGDVQLEIDDDGKPFYIQTYGDFISARNGFEVEGIVKVDPQTGKTK